MSARRFVPAIKSAGRACRRLQKITDTHRLDFLQQLVERPGFVGDVSIANDGVHALTVHAGPHDDFQSQVGWGDDIRHAVDRAIRAARRKAK